MYTQTWQKSQPQLEQCWLQRNYSYSHHVQKSYSKKATTSALVGPLPLGGIHWDRWKIAITNNHAVKPSWRHITLTVLKHPACIPGSKRSEEWKPLSSNTPNDQDTCPQQTHVGMRANSENACPCTFWKRKQLSIALLVFNTSWKPSYSRSPHITSTCPNILHLLKLKSLGAGIQPPLWHRNKTPWQCRRLQQFSQEIAMQMWGFPHHKRFRKRPHHPRNVPPKML